MPGPETIVQQNLIDGTRVPKDVALSLEMFRPCTERSIKDLFIIFNGVLTEISVPYEELSDIQADFIDKTLVITTRLIHHEVNTYLLDLPLTEYDQPPIIKRLPYNIEKIQAHAQHPGMADALRKFGDTYQPILSNEDSWLEVTSQFATGEINTQEYPQLSHELEDCATGFLHFLQRLAAKNGGLTEDGYMYRQITGLLDAYNKYKNPGLLDGNFGAADASA